MGQLIREDNTALNATYVYTYDHAGNILSKKEYALTGKDVTPTNPIYVYTYGYNDPNWGDKLTSYQDFNFTYDAIGNPLKYSNGRGYNFQWENGRRLRFAETDGYRLSFAYNVASDLAFDRYLLKKFSLGVGEQSILPAITMLKQAGKELS